VALERAHGRAQQVDFVLKVPQAKGVLFELALELVAGQRAQEREQRQGEEGREDEGVEHHEDSLGGKGIVCGKRAA